MLRKLLFITNLIVIFFLAKNSYAEISLLRDAETERFLYEISQPIFIAAKLNPKNIKIYIVNDNSLNAFVMGGQNVFINTGLIRKYSTPETLIGVIAHETGHISSGHLARSSEKMQDAQSAMLLSYLVGIGAIIKGSPEAGQAIIFGGNQTAQRVYMKFTRQQEEAADNCAIEYLDKIAYPADGLIKILEFFKQETIGYQGQIDEYLLSHPVNQKRIDLIKTKNANKNYSAKRINQRVQKMMDRVLAKLEGFMDNPDSILEKYKNNHEDLANYKKSIALHRKGKSKEAFEMLDLYLNKNQQDGFLLELKAQMLFESGKIEEAIIIYNQALKYLKKEDSSSIKISFAAAILSLKQDDSDLVNVAIKNLESAKELEEDNPMIFKYLASAYNKNKNETKSLIALAEFNFLLNKNEKCKTLAQLAKEQSSKLDKEDIVRCDDLIELCKESNKK
jgi:predicted Zn-dependent protease